MKNPLQANHSYSAWQYLGADILSACEPLPIENNGSIIAGAAAPDKINGSELVAVMTVGICPAALVEAVTSPKCRELARVFAAFYAQRPELTEKLLPLIRCRWNSTTLPDKVRRQALTNAWHTKPKWKDGKCLRDGFLTTDASQTEIAFAARPTNRQGEIGRREAVKQIFKRAELPRLQPWISRALNSALQELRAREFDVGWGC